MSKTFNASICNDCGCEESRFDKSMGKYCNNCAGTDFYYYDKYEKNFTVDILREKYKKAIQVSSVQYERAT